MLNRRRLLLGATALATTAAITSVPFATLSRAPAADAKVGEDVIAWLKANALPLATAEAGRGFHDLEPFGAMVGDARIVSMGEATHGTREFFQLKHRLIEYCVSELGFTMIAFEANYGSTLAVNDYVLGGKGSAAEAVVRGLQLAFWATEEVVALVEWVRAWNMTHDRKVKFYGFDMQWGTPSALHLLDYLRRVAPDLAAASEAPLSPVLRNEAFTLADAARDAILTHTQKILASFDAERAHWVGRSSELDWNLARLSAVTVEQNARFSGKPDREAFTWRDRCMAANVGALLEAEGPHAKALLWAHNAHVQRAPYVLGELMMGGFLHSEFGTQQVVIGFGFNQGGFRAVGKPGSGQIVDHVVGPAPAGHVDAALARTGFPLLALDLRRVPSIGPVADWMASKPLQRHVEAAFRPDYEMLVDRMVADDPRNKYDLLLFVETTTPARSIWRS